MPRQDIFTLIHKGIRSRLYDLGLAVQTTDFDDPAAAGPTLNKVRYDLAFLHEHAGHEEKHVFPPLQIIDEPLVKQKLDEAHRPLRRQWRTFGKDKGKSSEEGSMNILRSTSPT